MVRVNVEDVMSLIAKYKEMQSLNVDDVELYENGIKVIVPDNIKKDWKFCGLGFCGFIELEVYKYGFVDDSLNKSLVNGN